MKKKENILWQVNTTCDKCANGGGGMATDDQVQYWLEESLESLDAAKVLLRAEKYLEAGFFCNLACEKSLKAAFVKHTGKIPPKIH